MILLTGGAGFIGSVLVRHIIRSTDDSVVVVDKLTYAGNLESLADVANSPRFNFEKVDICDGPRIKLIFNKYRPDAIMHLAAESHVDRSIEGPLEFIHTNVLGTAVLLEAAREYWRSGAGPKGTQAFRFHHISTDEVYGDLGGKSGAFVETTPYEPSSPYSASKAGSDHLVRAWHRTYGLPIVLTNCSNNYGPYQFPEKLIPLMIINALNHKPLPIYGNGAQIRDWLYVEDHARALYEVVTQGRIGETYNIGGNNERTNIEVVNFITSSLDEMHPLKSSKSISSSSGSIGSYGDLISFVSDRPGHDRRYAVDASKIVGELGWQPRETFESGVRKTIQWYLDHREWCRRVQSGAYRSSKLDFNTGANR